MNGSRISGLRYVTLASFSRRSKERAAGNPFKPPLCHVAILYSFCLILSLSVPVFAVPAFGAGRTEAAFDAQCASSAELTPADDKKVDEIIIKLDKIGDTSEMMSAHLKLMMAAPQAINYCTIEQRLRRLNLSTHLVAVPLEQLRLDPREFSILYPMERFQTWSIVPRFTIWYERGGADAALKIIERNGLDPAQNYRNLNDTGAAANAEAVHSKYQVSPSLSTLEGLDSFWNNSLREYVEKGYLSNYFNTEILYALQDLVPNGERFSINNAPSNDVFSLYVVQSDPKRLLAGSHCNCGYLPGSRVIICDFELLKALRNWSRYTISAEDPAIMSVINSSTADFLFYWLLGHEVGHYVHKDNYQSNFTPSSDRDRAEAHPKHSAELAADQFAIEHMPLQARSFAYMSLNMPIQQLYHMAEEANRLKKIDPIALRSPPTGHPNLLLRLYNLKDATNSVDSMFEGWQKQFYDSTSGADFPSICSLAKGI